LVERRKHVLEVKKYQFWRLDSMLGFWVISELLGSGFHFIGKSIALAP
jgi:hypothetical protein